MKDISVIVISYNTKSITKRCLELVNKRLEDESMDYELIVVDNNSSDSSKRMLASLQNKMKRLHLILSKKNLGYAKANNLAFRRVNSRYTLLLNSDVLLTKEINFRKLLSFLDSHPKIGGLTVKVLLEDNRIDWASHRGFPTPWNSFCYFTGLESLFKHLPFFKRLFCGYHLLYKPMNKIHRIQAASGAFLLLRSSVLQKLKGFDESFFMYGEDLDLAFRMHKFNFELVYYPFFSVLHLKYKSGLKADNLSTRKKIKNYFYDAMKIFYQKHYTRLYPSWFNKLILFFIELKRKR